MKSFTSALAIFAVLVAQATAFVQPRTNTFVGQKRALSRHSLNMVTFSSPDDLQKLANKCLEDSCDVYERDSVVKELLQQRRELKSEISKINDILSDIGHIDDEENFVNFLGGGVMRAFGLKQNEPPAANTDGYAIGYSGDVNGKSKTFFSWDWDFAFPSFSEKLEQKKQQMKNRD